METWCLMGPEFQFEEETVLEMDGDNVCTTV